MTPLTRNELESLMSHEQPSSISTSMPVELGGPETRQNPIRLRKLLDHAEVELRHAGLSGPKAIARRTSGIQRPPAEQRGFRSPHPQLIESVATAT